MALADQQLNKILQEFQNLGITIVDIKARLENLERVIEKTGLDRARIGSKEENNGRSS